MPRLKIWVIILAILSSTLGIAGSFTIFFTALTNFNHTTRIEAPKIIVPVENISAFKIVFPPKETEAIATKEVSAPKKLLPKEEPKKDVIPIAEKPVATTKIIKPIAVAEKPVEKKLIIATKESPVVVVTPKEVEKILPKETEKEIQSGEEKIFDESELEQLVSRIKKARQEYGIIPNCIQISTSKSGNNRRATSQIESYLRSRKYSIAGKEITSTKFSGIQIREGNDCLQVWIGSF